MLDGRRATPRVLRFLGTTIVNLVNNRIKAAVKLRRRMAPPPKPELEIDPLDELAATVTGALTEAARGEIGGRLDACLAALPEKDRDVLACRYFLELGEEETATVLGVRRGTVKSRTSRALERLRSEMER